MSKSYKELKELMSEWWDSLPDDIKLRYMSLFADMSKAMDKEKDDDQPN